MRGMVAIVTGGASGIGFATVTRFVREGARVALVDVKSVDEAVSRIGAGKEALLGITTDVGDEAQVDNAYAAVDAAFGRLDVLVNCAGIGTPRPITIADA